MALQPTLFPKEFSVGDRVRIRATGHQGDVPPSWHGLAGTVVLVRFGGAHVDVGGGRVIRCWLRQLEAA